MDSLKENASTFLLNPQYAELLAIVKAARNGAVYGTKIRFPHAIVMIFLFRSGTIREKLYLVLKATRIHARNLATFAFIYKALMYLIRNSRTWLTSSTSLGKSAEASYDTFLAGLIGGYAVFGRGIQSSVNQQIVIYVFGRVILGLAKMSVERGGIVPAELRQRVTNGAWPAFAALSWGAVMWLYKWHPEAIQPSMRNSMKYIYSNADHWDGWKNFLVYNT